MSAATRPACASRPAAPLVATADADDAAALDEALAAPAKDEAPVAPADEALLPSATDADVVRVTEVTGTGLEP